MFCFFIVIAFLSLIINSTSYVLVQVRKGTNESNVDALIHKIVPTDQLTEFTDSLSRKHSNFKRFQVRQRSDDVVESDDDDNVEAVEKATTDGIDRIEKIVMQLAKGGKIGPMMRSRPEYNIQPQVVNLKGQHRKQSVMVNIDSRSIISAVKDLLSSKAIVKYADQVAEKAAMVYRALQSEMGKEKENEERKQRWEEERRKRYYNRDE